MACSGKALLYKQELTGIEKSIIILGTMSAEIN
jgi:hypothetical protein